MRALQLGIGMSDFRARLAQPEAQATEQTLTLPHAQPDGELTIDKRCQRFAVPQVGGNTGCLGRLAERATDGVQLRPA